VSKRFGGVQALRDVDFAARPGVITAIIGANGAGKTTLLNAISGHVPGDAGEIRLADGNISRLGPEKIARSGISRTFQTPQVPESLTVLEIAASARIGPNWVSALSIALRTPGYLRRRKDDVERARAALAFVGLTARENALASELPLGQRRILEVARCIAAEPAVVLLDEPAAGLDPAGLEHLHNVLMRLRDAGATVVLIEHNVTFVMDVADRVFVMDLGAMIAEGTPDEVRNDEQVIASYLGRRHSTHHTLDDAEPVAAEARARLQVVNTVERQDKGEVVLEADGVRFAYGDLVAVWDVSLRAKAGEAVAVVGRNGAGKTTLMFGLAGSLPTNAGSVTLLGQDVTSRRAEDRASAGLCLVPEGKRVFRELTVEENIAVSLPRSVRGKDRRRQIDETLERFPILGEKRADRAGALSGGQQQLLAIASAVTMQPKVLLVDEPSSGLSPLAVDMVMATLEELKNEGLALVLVEQLVEDVVTGIADHVIVIEQGHVVMEDIPENISLADLEQRIYVA
jgi:ABC-type branched-subunit amino acid transport system ATPase component